MNTAVIADLKTQIGRDPAHVFWICQLMDARGFGQSRLSGVELWGADL